MTEPLEALRGYVHFLHEHEGVRQVRLSRTAREGLAKLVAGSRRPPGDGAFSAGGTTSRSSAPSTGAQDRTPPRPPVARNAPSTTETDGGRRPPQLLPTAGSTIEISGSTKVEQLRHLAERASACIKCPHLVARRHTVVFGVGNPDAKLMFVGEAPGEEEDLTKQEMDTCVPYLRAQIDVIKPVAMVALGATAVEGLLGPIGTIGSLRGKFLEYRSTPLMPTYHPSYLLRNQSNTEKRKVWEDLLKVMERLEMPVTDKQRGFFLAK